MDFKSLFVVIPLVICIQAFLFLPISYFALRAMGVKEKLLLRSTQFAVIVVAIQYLDSMKSLLPNSQYVNIAAIILTLILTIFYINSVLKLKFYKVILGAVLIKVLLVPIGYLTFPILFFIGLAINGW